MNKSTKTNRSNADYCVVINTFPLLVKEYQNRRVVTFNDVDAVHGRHSGTARKRFNDNKKHFIEGEDFYILKQPSEIRTLGITRPQGGTPESIVLVTESGYLMLVKSFTDDLAWDVQRQLVNSYFKSKSELQIAGYLCSEVAALKSELMEIRSTLRNIQPAPPNYWLWKKHVVSPTISTLTEKLHIDDRMAYDLIYDTMFVICGFDRSFAINQFCTKYNTESASVIDAVADDPVYRQKFITATREILEN